MTAAPVYIHGVAVLTGWADATVDLGTFIFRGVTAALADAGKTMSDIDSVVLAAHDLVDGRSLSSMVTAPAAGAYFRDEIRLCEDGLAALSLAAARIEAREFKFSVVAAWGRASEGDYRNVSRASVDPFTLQAFGLDDFTASAFRMNCWSAEYDRQGGDARARARDMRRSRAAANSRSMHGETRSISLGHPFLEAEEPKLCDVIAVAIVGHAPAAIRITGVGHGTDMAAIGDRNLLAMTPLVQAAQRAGAFGGGLDLYELDSATLGDEAIALEALGVAAPGEGFKAYADHPGINPSGGGAAGWSYPANGLWRLAEACLQMRGAAGGVQLATPPRTALVTGFSQVGGQIATAVRLEAI